MQASIELLSTDRLFVGGFPRRGIMVIVIVMSDLLSLIAGLWAATVTRDYLSSLLVRAGWSGHTFVPSRQLGVADWQFAFIFVILAIFASRGLYPGTGLGPVKELRALTRNTTLGIFSLIALTFLFKQGLHYSRGVIMLAWCYLVLMVPLARLVTRQLLCRMRLWGELVAVFGDQRSTRSLIDRLRSSPMVGYVPAIVIEVRKDFNPIDQEELSACLVNSWMQVQGSGIHTAFVALSGELRNGLELTGALEPHFRHVYFLFAEEELPLDLVEVQQLASFTTLHVRNSLVDPRALLVKRMIDILLGGILSLLLLPILVAISVAIKLDSPGPALFVQHRVGRGGRTFPLLKFRSMFIDAEQRLSEVLAADPERAEEWKTYQKLRSDPRITRIGRLLREFSLDELPQLWNVLRGQMSLVGPRPILPNQEEEYREVYDSYVRVPPGITGAWQVNGRNLSTFQERVKLDDYYVRNWSIWLDIYILARTPMVVLSREGAY